MICENHNFFIFTALNFILQEFRYIGREATNHIHNISRVKSPKIRYFCVSLHLVWQHLTAARPDIEE